ncbi:Anaphase promoting complex subunit 7 [Actinomortierella wolfii]|nr:Anaphase promoting complex subunit 7 [Actinomortierella wolfii]
MGTEALPPTERLAQLKRYKALYDEGLYQSALVMIGMQLCTITVNEEWFMEQALSLYARCLTKSGQHQRAVRYFERALHYQAAAIPSELLQSTSANHDSTVAGDDAQSSKGQPTSEAPAPTSTTTGVPPPPPPATTGSVSQAASSTTTAIDRDQLKDNLIKTMARFHGIKRKAMHSGASQLPSEGPDLSRSSFFMLDDQLRSKSVKASHHLLSSTMSSSTSAERTSTSDRSPSPMTGATTSSKEAAEATESSPGGSSNLVTATLGRSKGMDFDARLQYATSLVNMGELVRASRELAKFPVEKRSVEFYLLNIRISEMKKAVINRELSQQVCWERIAQQHATAIEAHLNLLRLKVPLEKVLQLIPEAIYERSWMIKYLRGMDLLFKMKYHEALLEFESLNKQYQSNVDIMLMMASCHFWLGAPVDAYMDFLAIQKVDRCVNNDIHLYAILLRELNKLEELGMLVVDLMQYEDKLAETWVVHAIYCQSHQDVTKALQSVNRAISIDPEHAGAHRIRGQLLLDSDPKEALVAFREAHRLQKSILTYEGLVNAYLAQLRAIEAIETAKDAKRDLPESARALALYGTTLFKTSGGRSDDSAEALQILRDALAKDPSCPEAAMGLVLVLEHQKQYTKALEVLDELLEGGRSSALTSNPLVLEDPAGLTTTATATTTNLPSSFTFSAARPVSVVQIHLRKAELYNGMSNWEQCYLSYQRALAVDPTNETAKLGLAQVERIFNGGEDEEEDEDEEVEGEVEGEDDVGVGHMGTDHQHAPHLSGATATTTRGGWTDDDDDDGGGGGGAVATHQRRHIRARRRGEAPPPSSSYYEDTGVIYTSSEAESHEGEIQHHGHGDIEASPVFEPPSELGNLSSSLGVSGGGASSMDVEMEDPFAAPTTSTPTSMSTRTPVGSRRHHGRQRSPVLHLRRRDQRHSPAFDEDDHGHDHGDGTPSLRGARNYRAALPTSTATTTSAAAAAASSMLEDGSEEQSQGQDSVSEGSNRFHRRGSSGGGSVSNAPTLVAAGRGFMLRDGRTPFPGTPAAASAASASGPAMQGDIEGVVTPAQRRQRRQAVEGGREGVRTPAAPGSSTAVTTPATATAASGVESPAYPPQSTPSFQAAVRQQQARIIRHVYTSGHPFGGRRRGGGVEGEGGGVVAQRDTLRRGQQHTVAQREREFDELEEEQM